MMCWNWIDSSRKREALTNDLVSRTRHTVPSAVHGRAWTKNRENNPMQSRRTRQSAPSGDPAAGREKKNAPLADLLLRCVRAREEKCAVVRIEEYRKIVDDGTCRALAGQTLRVCPEGKP